jgi:DNA-binding transcriptional ArsR family regulator
MGIIKKPLITLASEHQLRIYMLPLRQTILRTMRILGKPATAKHIADMLGISPSSSRHHLLKLQEIGLVSHDHYELIKGIRAEYLRLADVDVSIGTNINDALTDQRDALTRTLVGNLGTRFLSAIPKHREAASSDPSWYGGDLYSGIAHLDEHEARELFSLITTFLDAHDSERASEGRVAWEFAVMLSRATP